MKLFSANKNRNSRMNFYKKIFSLLFLIAFSMAAICQNLPKKPEPPKLVNDYTNTLTEDQKQSLENKLVAFDDSTSTQIAVVIIPSLDGYDVAEYNVALGRAWGVGGQEFSNGVILLIAKNDRKLNIATGYVLKEPCRILLQSISLKRSSSQISRARIITVVLMKVPMRS